MSGNNAESPFGTLNLVNLGRTLADHPDENRTHIVIDYVFDPFKDADVGRTGYIRCEIYRGPPLVDIIAHLCQSALSLDADPVAQGVNIPRRSTLRRAGERAGRMAERSETIEKFVRSIARCWRPRLAVLLVVTSWLAGCATGSFESGVAVCPPVVEYSPEFQVRSADEVAVLPEGSAIPENAE